MISPLENYNIQKKLIFIVITLFIIKIIAWYLTNSIAILTDALEYTINVISGLISLYSLYISAKPRDTNHPYGHGKVEFLSAAIEGTLMIVSSFFIIYEAINNLKHPHTITEIDNGLYLLGVTALINFGIGRYAVKKGNDNNSLALIATGKHMLSDTIATGGIIFGLILMMITGYTWIDSVIAFIFALIIIIEGYKILRSSIAGIMDEADSELLNKVVAFLNASKRDNWVDLHNLRIIKYGSVLHLDCHLTVPWFFNVHEAHREMDALDTLVKENFGESVELFIHTDGCLDFSCAICTKKDCPYRNSPFVKKLEWTTQSIVSNNKHRLEALPA